MPDERDGLTWRVASPSDLEALGRAQRETFRVSRGRWPEVEEVEMMARRTARAITDESGNLLEILESRSTLGDGCSGYYWLAFDKTDPMLMDLHVNEACRGKGLGRRLLQRVVETVRTRGADRFALAVSRSNAAALSLYGEFGASCLEEADGICLLSIPVTPTTDVG